MEPADLKLISKDYDIKENEKFRKELIQVDVELINAFFGGQNGKHSRVRRFQADYVGNNKDVYSFDSESESKLAYRMYIEDIMKVRKKVIEVARSAYCQ